MKMWIRKPKYLWVLSNPTKSEFIVKIDGKDYFDVRKYEKWIEERTLTCIIIKWFNKIIK